MKYYGNKVMLCHTVCVLYERYVRAQGKELSGLPGVGSSICIRKTHHYYGHDILSTYRRIYHTMYWYTVRWVPPV